MHTDRCGDTPRQKYRAKGDTTNVEPEMQVSTSNCWGHRNINKRHIEKFGSHTRKTFNSLTTTDSCTWNITHNNGMYCGLKLEALAVRITVGSRGEVPGRRGL